MDRISALRNVERVLAAFEEGEIDLAEAERQATTVLRTFASEFDRPDRAVYRARVAGDERVVIADSSADARERVARLTDSSPEAVSVEPVEDG